MSLDQIKWNKTFNDMVPSTILNPNSFNNIFLLNLDAIILLRTLLLTFLERVIVNTYHIQVTISFLSPLRIWFLSLLCQNILHTRFWRNLKYGPILAQKVSKAAFWMGLLELRHYKNGLASVKNMFVLKLPPFSPTYTAREKGR